MTRDVLSHQMQIWKKKIMGPTWGCRRLHTRPKYWIISYFECNWNIHNWLGAGSEPWVILRLFLIFQDLSLMILIKIILIKKKACTSSSLKILRDGLQNNKAFVGLGSCDNVQTERSIFKYANWFEYANWSV